MDVRKHDHFERFTADNSFANNKGEERRLFINLEDQPNHYLGTLKNLVPAIGSY